MDTSFSEKQNLLTTQMQKIDDAIERANLVNNSSHSAQEKNRFLTLAIGVLGSIVQEFVNNGNFNVQKTIGNETEYIKSEHTRQQRTIGI